MFAKLSEFNLLNEMSNNKTGLGNILIWIG